jgi:septal ring factor EnvC (AmiA/AmiB activator)
MFSLFLKWIVQPKNTILILIIVAFLGLLSHDIYLKHIVNKKEEKIQLLNKNIDNLNKNINDLKSNIELQNQAIKKMNDDFNAQKNAFEKEYSELQNKNKSKIIYIKKQTDYVSPENVKTQQDELDESRKLINDFLFNRRGQK